jgi:hypothetical protein
MPEYSPCPYYTDSGYCNISPSLTDQSGGHKENYCATEKGKENWRRCANYQGASEKSKIEKRVR